MSSTFKLQSANGEIVRSVPFGITYAVGTTVPSDATAGYAPGCIFQDLNASQYSQFYINEGSNTSCDFNAVILPGVDLSGLTATAAEINRVAKLSTRVVSLTGSTSITTALHSDKVLLLNASGAAYTMTLPAATGTGSRFHFKVGTVNTSNYVIATAASEYFAGNILTNSSSDSVTVEPWISLYATHNIKITLDGTTKGGVSIGDWIEVVDIATATWSVTGITTSSGTEATPFSTS